MDAGKESRFDCTVVENKNIVQIKNNDIHVYMYIGVGDSKISKHHAVLRKRLFSI